jgi:hypothetical protein
MIADILVSKDTAKWKPALKPNNDWRNWPNAGHMQTYYVVQHGGLANGKCNHTGQILKLRCSQKELNFDTGYGLDILIQDIIYWLKSSAA